MFTLQQILNMKAENRTLIACYEMHEREMPDTFFLVENDIIINCFDAYEDENENIYYVRVSTLDLCTTDMNEMAMIFAEDHWIMRIK